MPGILNLSATNRFKRPKPDVSACPIACSASSQARDSPRVSHPDASRPLHIPSGKRHSLTHTGDVPVTFKDFCKRNAPPPISRPGTHRFEAYRDADSPHSNAAEPNSTPTHSLPSETTSFSERTNVRSSDSLTSTRGVSSRSTFDTSTLYSPPAINATTPPESDDDDRSSSRRSHAIIAGRLIPAIISRKGHRSANKPNNPAAGADNAEREQVEVAVGARAFLHTAQDFPFDLRRNRYQNEQDSDELDGLPEDHKQDLDELDETLEVYEQN